MSTRISISYTDSGAGSKAWQQITAGSAPATLYARPPADFDAANDAAIAQLARPRPWAELADLLHESGRRYGVPDATLARLSEVRAGRAVMVVTGQQVGYLGGPLFTLLKAYHTTRLAAELEQRLGMPVLPLFWLEGEDHDLEEVRSAPYLTSSGELRALRFEPEREIAGFEVGRYAVDGSAHIDELAAALDSRSESGLELLRRAYRDTTLSDAMGKLLAETLGPRGLLIVEGMEPELKRMAMPLWDRVLTHGPALGGMLSIRAEDLRAEHYNAPLSPTPDSYLFYVTAADHVRAAMSYGGRLLHPDGSMAQYTPATLRELLASGELTISPKAALRPLYQDYVLPTVAYVGGPGELDYHAQLAPFYAELDVVAPTLFPRLSATLVDAKTARLIEKLDLPAADLLYRDKHALTQTLLRAADEGKTAARFAETRAGLEEIFNALKPELGAIDTTLEGAAHGAAGKALHALSELEQKAQKALKQKHGVELARLEKILAAVKPGGKPAERVLSTGYYLARFGLDALLAALDGLPADGRAHWLVELDVNNS